MRSCTFGRSMMFESIDRLAGLQQAQEMERAVQRADLALSEAIAMTGRLPTAGSNDDTLQVLPLRDPSSQPRPRMVAEFVGVPDHDAPSTTPAARPESALPTIDATAASISSRMMRAVADFPRRRTC